MKRNGRGHKNKKRIAVKQITLMDSVQEDNNSQRQCNRPIANALSFWICLTGMIVFHNSNTLGTRGVSVLSLWIMIGGGRIYIVARVVAIKPGLYPGCIPGTPATPLFPLIFYYTAMNIKLLCNVWLSLIVKCFRTILEY